MINATNGSVGPQLVTQDLGDPGSTAFITGVVYQDSNSNNFYDIGEGRSGVRVDVEGAGYFAISTDSGGYAIPVTADGVYPVNFTGGGFSNFSTTATITGGLNVKLDDKVTAAVYAADFNHNGIVNADDLAKWRGDFGLNANSNADGDADSDGADFLEWQRELGLGGPTLANNNPVPEPNAALLAATALGILLANRRPSP